MIYFELLFMWNDFANPLISHPSILHQTTQLRGQHSSTPGQDSVHILINGEPINGEATTPYYQVIVSEIPALLAEGSLPSPHGHHTDGA